MAGVWWFRSLVVVRSGAGARLLSLLSHQGSGCLIPAPPGLGLSLSLRRPTPATRPILGALAGLFRSYSNLQTVTLLALGQSLV